MESALYEALKAALTDKAYRIPEKGDVKLIDLVADWEEGVTKTRSANKDLTGQREDWEKERKELKAQLADFVKKVSEYEEKVKTSESSKGDKEKIKTEYEKQLNELRAQLETISQQFAAAQKSAEENARRAKDTSRASAEEKLRTDIFSELSKHKIVGEQANALYLLMRERGTVAIDEGEDGGFKRNFTIEKDGRKFPGDLGTVAKKFAEENPWAISASGKAGPGDEHQGRGGADSGMFQFTGKETLDQLKTNFRAGLQPQT